MKEVRCSGDFPAIYLYEYDAAKRITKINASPADEDTYDMTFSYDKNGTLLNVKCKYWDIVFSYNNDGKLIKKVQTTYEGFVNTFAYEYNGRGDIIRKTESNKFPSSSFKGVTEYKYDERGALIKLVSTDSYGSTIEKEYKNDAYGNPVEIKETKTSNGDFISSYSYTYSYEYETAKIAVTRSDGDKKIYEYQKNESIVTPETNLF